MIDLITGITATTTLVIAIIIMGLITIVMTVNSVWTAFRGRGSVAENTSAAEVSGKGRKRNANGAADAPQARG